MVSPKPTYNPEPQFSPEARNQKKQGVVTVLVVVTHDGSVQSACVNHPFGYGLDEQAVDAVRTWKFQPATFNGQPMATQILVEVDFHLFEKPGETTSDDPKASAATAQATPTSGAASPDAKPAAVNATAPAATKITTVGIGKGVTPPRLIFSPAPEKTQGSALAKYSGTVTLQLIVTTEGKAENIKVLKSLGPGLDQKAIDAVSKWKFEPAVKDGQPFAVEIAVEVDFHLY
jgi:TonB family protein